MEVRRSALPNWSRTFNRNATCTKGKGEEVASTVVYKVSTVLCIKWSLLPPPPPSPLLQNLVVTLERDQGTIALNSQHVTRCITTIAERMRVSFWGEMRRRLYTAIRERV